MYVSMTGFSRVEKPCEWGTLTLELSSVNHRYQEIYMRTPRDFASWEPWFHQNLRRAFRRGKIHCRLDILWGAGYRANRLNRETLLVYRNELMSLAEQVGDKTPVRLESRLSFPGVLDAPLGGAASLEETEKIFAELLAEGVEQWQAMRRREGAHLHEAIMADLALLEKQTQSIERDWKVAYDKAQEGLRTRLAEMLTSLGERLDESRFAQEVVILVDRWDVSEEITRLKSHFQKFRQFSAEKDCSGRKLDFLLQEMNREVNTLDSKVADAAIRWQAVESKAILERIREQIQNLE